MPRRGPVFEPKRPASLSAEQIRAALPKLQRRLQELRAISADLGSDNSEREYDALHLRIDETLESIFPRGTSEYDRYRIPPFHLSAGASIVEPWDDRDVASGYQRAAREAITSLETAATMLRERLEDLDASPGALAIQAFEGLELHPDIHRRVDRLYRDRHYAHAVHDAVKALRDLVRLRSGRADLDGVPLMQTVFSPKNPVLRFNDLKDQTDQDEQIGFMWLFSGAVMGLRNPRAHAFVNDDPERALEFIAFVSLLAKILNNAK